MVLLFDEGFSYNIPPLLVLLFWAERHAMQHETHRNLLQYNFVVK